MGTQYLKMFLPKLTLVLLSLVLSEVQGFRSGAPQSACQNMKPGPPHGENRAKAIESPFILIAKKVKRRSKQVRVILKSESSGDRFRGFLLMAEVGGARGLGYFIPSQASKALVQSLDCPDLPSTCPEPSACQGTANAVTHSSNEDKQSVAVVWTPPSKVNGTVQFLATFVGENSEDNSTWWHGVTSKPVKI